MLAKKISNYFACYKVKDAAQAVTRLGLEPNLRILDIGAGVGASVPHFNVNFDSSRPICVDVSRRSLELGVAQHHNTADFVCFDGTRLPFVDDSFDLAFAACVFHHIPRTQHANLLSGLSRVVRGAGALMVFEHNPLNPVTRKVARDWIFDENAVLLRAVDLQSAMAGAGLRCELACRLFFPTCMRWLRPLERWLEWLPLGAHIR